MKPPADRLLNLQGTGTDVPAVAPLRYGLPWSVVFAAATLLALFSTLMAWRFTASLGHEVKSWSSLITLNASYWYVWALFTPAIIWLSQHFRFERQGLWRALLVHVPSVIIFSLAHIVSVASVQWWLARTMGRPFGWWSEVQKSALLNFDWEMMTYWSIVGLSHALRYQREARARELNAAQLQTRLVEARLQTLQRQLQPHFLFNTLNTISALMHRDVDAADEMIARLSDLLRMSLQRVGVQEVPLKDELDFLSKYLEIEQTRFRDRLTVVFDVHSDTLDALVPNLLLQPLVENAIKHGIGPRPTPGQITVRARRVGALLELDIQDNGVGLSAARLTDFNRGVGLSNTRSRLDHLYGSLHRFEFRQPAEGGLLVLIAIPMAELASGSTEVRDDSAVA